MATVTYTGEYKSLTSGTLKVSILDTDVNVQYDISDMVKSVAYSTTVEPQPDKATIEVIVPFGDNRIDESKKGLRFSSGSIIAIRYGDWKVFKGVLFTKAQGDNATTIQLIAYDQTRYLSSCEGMLFKGYTASDIFKWCCNRFAAPVAISSGKGKLKYEIVDKSTYKIKEVSHDNVSLYSMIQDAIEATEAGTMKINVDSKGNVTVKPGTRYIIYDDYGVLKFVNNARLHSKLVISRHVNLLGGWSWEVSIDNSYSQVKGYVDDKTTGQRKSVTDYKSKFVKKWGLLQRYEAFHQDTTAVQLALFVKTLTQQMAVEQGKLSGVRTFGLQGVRAGYTIDIIMPLIDNKNQNRILIESCEHAFTQGSFLTTIDATVITDS